MCVATVAFRFLPMKALAGVCLTVTALIAGCGRSVEPPVPPAFPPASVTVPQGTELIVRTVEPMDIAAVTEGKSWSAVLAQSVRNAEGYSVVSAGSPVYFGVAPGSGALQLVIRSVVWNGSAYIVNVPVTAGEASVAGLEPWGAATKVREVKLAGERIVVPGQTLLSLKLGSDLALR